MACNGPRVHRLPICWKKQSALLSLCCMCKEGSIALPPPPLSPSPLLIVWHTPLARLHTSAMDSFGAASSKMPMREKATTNSCHSVEQVGGMARKHAFPRRGSPEKGSLAPQENGALGASVCRFSVSTVL